MFGLIFDEITRREGIMRQTRKITKEKALLLCAAIGMLFLGGCASTLQFPPFPDQTKKVEDPGKARIYVIRKEKVFGAGEQFPIYGPDSTASGPRVSKGGSRLIGKVGPGSYICWEELPGAYPLQRVSRDPASVCTLDLVAGNVYYLRVHENWSGLKAVLDILDDKEGQRLLKKCEPPDAYRKPR